MQGEPNTCRDGEVAKMGQHGLASLEILTKGTEKN